MTLESLSVGGATFTYHNESGGLMNTTDIGQQSRVRQENTFYKRKRRKIFDIFGAQKPYLGD